MEHIYLAEKLREFSEADLALRAERGQLIGSSRPGLARLLADCAGRALVLLGCRLQGWGRQLQAADHSRFASAEDQASA